jgi:hypothetical protein
MKQRLTSIVAPFLVLSSFILPGGYINSPLDIIDILNQNNPFKNCPSTREEFIFEEESPISSNYKTIKV